LSKKRVADSGWRMVKKAEHTPALLIPNYPLSAIRYPLRRHVP
jgi:hypothetical protein